MKVLRLMPWWMMTGTPIGAFLASFTLYGWSIDTAERVGYYTLLALVFGTIIGVVRAVRADTSAKDG